jgi:hypothetical protein
LPLEVREGGLIVKGGVFPDIVVVVDIAQGFSQKIGFAMDLESSGDIKLLIIGAMRALQVSVFLVLPLVRILYGFGSGGSRNRR